MGDELREDAERHVMGRSLDCGVEGHVHGHECAWCGDEWPCIVRQLLNRIDVTLAYADDPGNWSAYDNRRRIIVSRLNGGHPDGQ